MQKNSFSKNSLLTFLTEISVFILGLGSLIIISRILGPEGKGIYSLIILIPGLMMVFSNFGIDAANIYFVGKKKYKIENVVSNSLVLAIVLGIILILIFLGVSQFDFFQKFVVSNKIPLFCLWLVVLIIPISLLSNFFRSILWGKGEIMNCNKIRIIESLVSLFGVIFLLLLLKQGVFGAVFSYVSAILLAALTAVFFLKKADSIHFSFNRDLLKDSFFYGGKVYLANALSFLNYRLDMILIAAFLTPAAVGLYSIAVSIAEKLFIISGVLASVLFAKISSISDVEANSFTPKVVRHTFFIMILGSLLLAFFIAPLIKILFGSAFLPSVRPLIILLPGIIAFGVGGVISSDLAGRGKPQFAIYAAFVCLIVNVILNILLIPKWGIEGAAFASTVSYWTDTLVMILAFLRISQNSLSEVLLVKKQDFEDYKRLYLTLIKK